MKRHALLLVFMAVVLVFGARPLLAHHGAAAFETTKTVTVTGVMTKFVFQNPHSQLYFEVKNDKGETEEWNGEITAPNKLARAGWTKGTLKPGDKVTISGNQAKNGAHMLWIRSIVGPTGEQLPLSEN